MSGTTPKSATANLSDSQQMVVIRLRSLPAAIPNIKQTQCIFLFEFEVGDATRARQYPPVPGLSTFKQII